MADMDWVRKTHDVYIEGMQQHAAELENNNERHLYGAAISRITLLMEHISRLEKNDGYSGHKCRYDNGICLKCHKEEKSDE